MGSPGNWGSAWERPADATARGKGGSEECGPLDCQFGGVDVGRSGCFVHAVPSSRRQEQGYLALALCSRRQPCAALGPFPQRCSRAPRRPAAVQLNLCVPQAGFQETWTRGTGRTEACPAAPALGRRRLGKNPSLAPRTVRASTKIESKSPQAVSPTPKTSAAAASV